MNSFQQLRVDRDERGVVTVKFEVTGQPINVFDENLVRDLGIVARELREDASVRIVVFRSGNATGFMAGADVHRIHDIDSADEAEAILASGQQLFRQIEALPMPTIAVIHGPCLGAGLEFSLACTYRIGRDDPSTRLGLPETQLGLIPGWGGTQRLPRVVGLTAALEMILEGSRLTPARARQLGLLDAIFPPADFERGAEQFITGCLEGWKPARAPRNWLNRLKDGTKWGRKLVFRFARLQIDKQARYYPALTAAIRAIEAGTVDESDAGLATERAEFRRVLFTPACRNLLDLFLQRERARHLRTWSAVESRDLRPTRSIAVVGAGVMGSGIAQLAASQGFTVCLTDIDEAAVRQGIRRIEQLMQHAVSKGALSSSDASRAMSSMTTTTTLSQLQSVDLVIEAVVERLDIKQQVFRELDRLLPATTLLVSNTSALPISQIAEMTGNPHRVAGLHFFNPVYKMPLVEIVNCPNTSDETAASLVEVVRRLGKTPIIVAERSGFLVNRILFPYLDEAVRMVVEGIPADLIDWEAKEFGFPMGPLELLDLVGIDVAADVARSLAPLCPEASPTPQRLSDMLMAGCQGQKSGQGFYTYRRGRRGRPAIRGGTEPASAKLPQPCDFPDETLSGIQQRLVFPMINAAADCLNERVVPEPWMVDLGMVLGTGFPPFRGGPLKLVDTLGHAKAVDVLHEISETCGPRFRPSIYFSHALTRYPDSTTEIATSHV